MTLPPPTPPTLTEGRGPGKSQGQKWRRRRNTTEEEKEKLNQLSRNNILHYIHMNILYMSVCMYVFKCFLFFINFYWSIIALQCC